MTGNIIDFNGFKKKTSEKNSDSYDLAMAKHLLKSDEQLRSTIDALGVSLEQAAGWMVKITELQRDLEILMHLYSSETDHSPIFAGLVTQVMANELSDQLTTLGMNSGVSKSAFQRFQKNAISALVQARHREDITPDGFETFDGEDHE